MRGRLLCLGLSLVFCAGCGSQPKSITIFTAASAEEAVQEIARDFEAETGFSVEVIPGPSSGLARQIEQGAAADLFLSADVPMADYLDSRDLVEQRRDLLGNQLVVVVPASSTLSLAELQDLADPRLRTLAVAEEKVPAGEYARQALRKAGVWEQVEGKVRGGTDVRQVLQLVATGQVDAGLVYHTDTLGQARVREAFTVKADLHAPIRYPLVLIRRGPVKEAARRFYDYLGSDKAASVFRRAQFAVVQSVASGGR